MRLNTTNLLDKTGQFAKGIFRKIVSWGTLGLAFVFFLSTTVLGFGLQGVSTGVSIGTTVTAVGLGALVGVTRVMGDASREAGAVILSRAKDYAARANAPDAVIDVDVS